MSGEWTISRKMTRQSKRTRQKNQRRNRKGESDNNPEIPDWGETSDIPGLPLQIYQMRTTHNNIKQSQNKAEV